MSEDDIRREDYMLRQKLNEIMQRRPVTFEDLNAKLSKEGSVLSVVILRADGTAHEMELNITHNLASAKQVLGGEVSILGRWEHIEV